MSMVDVDKLQFGLETFGDIVRGEDGELLTAGQSIRESLRKANWPTNWGSTSLVSVSIIDLIIVCRVQKLFWDRLHQ